MIGWGGKDFRWFCMVSCNTWGGKEKMVDSVWYLYRHMMIGWAVTQTDYNLSALPCSSHLKSPFYLSTLDKFDDSVDFGKTVFVYKVGSIKGTRGNLNILNVNKKDPIQNGFGSILPKTSAPRIKTR